MNDFASAAEASASEAGKNQDLLEKIKRTGYRTNDRGEVLYDNRWIAASEWTKRMPDALG